MAAPLSVLQLSPFRVPAEPSSGGEVRVAALGDAYRRHGWALAVSAVVPRREASTPLDVPLPWLASMAVHYLGAPRGMRDLRCAWYCAGSARPLRQLRRLAPGEVHLIQAEHPWVFPLASRLRQRLWPGARLIYSSHNVEWALHQQLWQRPGRTARALGRAVEEVRALETACARTADLCLAVSEADAEVLRAFGARAVAVVPNGASPLRPGPLPAALRDLGPYALFAASAHRPNLEGFVRYAGEALDWVPPGARVVVAGSAGPALLRRPALARLAGLPGARLQVVGTVPRATLDGLLVHAHAVLLPIGEGSGTNLKTAEALASGRPAVATPHSLRGFERFADAPGLLGAASPGTFQAAAGRLLAAPRRPDARHPRAPELTWAHSGRRLLDAVGLLLGREEAGWAHAAEAGR